jgi:hypothetical protein
MDSGIRIQIAIHLDIIKGIGHTFAMTYDMRQSFQNLARYNQRVNNFADNVAFLEGPDN